MKRCVSIALILALLGLCAVSPALAEETGIIAEAEVIEVNAIDGPLSELENGDAPGESTETAEEAVALAPEDTEDAAGEKAATGPEDEEGTADEKAASASTTPASVGLSAQSISIGVGEKYSLAVVASPEGSTLPGITWRSANKKIAKVGASTGAVTGVKKGSTTVYARLADSNIELKCKVTVKAKPGKVTLGSSSLTLSVGMGSVLKATLPKGTASGALAWASSKPGVAAVDDSGAITALKAGTTSITVRTYNGKKATCKVKVLAAPASACFPDTILSIAVGQTTAARAIALTAKGVETPAAMTYAIEENSPDADCVTVDAATGALKGVRRGTAILRATTHNGVVARCQVEVDVAPKAVKLNVSSITIGAKEVYTGLTAQIVAPDGADSCAQSLAWTSSNKKVATVDPGTGAITGVKKGSATVTVSTPNGKTAKCKVKVLKAPTSVSLSPSIGVLEVGKKGQYKVSLPSGCGGSLSYASSNTNVAIVDGAGIVTAVAPGTAKITVTTYNGKSKTSDLLVNGGIFGEGESDGSKAANEERIQYLLLTAKTKKGAPYVYGAFGPSSFDCSGFVYWCFKQINIKLKDTAYKQGYDNTYPLVSYNALKPGDLVFFNTQADSDLSDHSGIYLGNGEFIHASSTARKVIISKLNSGYYKRNFSWGRRVLE